MTPGGTALRQRRAGAARALASDPRSAQLDWDDLAAWPAWAALDAAALHTLAQRCGAWLHAAAVRRCISGATLQQVRAVVGDAAFARLMQGPDAPCEPLPPADALDDWLAAEGLEALIATVPSPLLRLLLRERHAPQRPPPLPALDDARARHAVQEAMR